MKISNNEPLQGMQELLPQEQAVFNSIKDTIREVYRRYGFLEIETPTIDRAEILFAKAGGETEKQIYKVIKTEETADDADQALRFDNTVPLARYVARYEGTNELNFPFRVSQVARNFRGERAQTKKGRFREFYQCDVDIIGRNSLPIEYDAEVILVLKKTLDVIWRDSLQTTPPTFEIRVSNRKILSGFLEALNLQDKSKDILLFIDKAEKTTPEERESWLKELQLGAENTAKILEFIQISGKPSEVRQALMAFGFQDEEKYKTFNDGINELDAILRTLEKQGLSNCVKGDMKIVRGLDYYTGTVFETFITNRTDLGSICSGGRYDNLLELYSNNKFPGVGGSIGLTRLFSILKNELGQVDAVIRQPVDYAIIPITPNDRTISFALADAYRNRGYSVDVILSDKEPRDRNKRDERIARVAKKKIEFSLEYFKAGRIDEKEYIVAEEGRRKWVLANNRDEQEVILRELRQRVESGELPLSI